MTISKKLHYRKISHHDLKEENPEYRLRSEENKENRSINNRKPRRYGTTM